MSSQTPTSTELPELSESDIEFILSNPEYQDGISAVSIADFFGDFKPDDCELFESGGPVVGLPAENVHGLNEAVESIGETNYATPLDGEQPGRSFVRTIAGRFKSGTSFDPSRFDTRTRVIHSLHRCHQETNYGERLSNILFNRPKDDRRSFGGIWAARHNNHIHVVHGCNYASKQCRCLKISDIFGKAFKSKHSNGYAPGDKAELWDHLDSGYGHRQWIVMQNACGNTPIYGGSDFILDQWGEGEQDTHCAGFDDTGPVSGTKRMGDVEGGPEPKKSKTDQVEKPKYIFAIETEIFKQWTKNINKLRTPEILEKYGKQLIFFEKSLDQQFKSLVSITEAKVQNMLLIDIWNTLWDKNPTFGLHSMQSRDQSFEALKIWYTQQSDNKPKELVNWFHQWFDRLTGKKNTILLQGPPNCAKTWVANAWCALGLFVGKIKNHTKNSTFTFGDLGNCRIIFHNECKQPLNNDGGYLEKLKEIYEGQPAAVDVKYKTYAETPYAPVIATCNSYPVENSNEVPAFEERWRKINCRVIPELKDYCHSPCNPMAVFDLVIWAQQLVE